jgi:predicted Rossmann fold nucleotide-binding protein DprA/Smf involved in DNA uptake
VIVDPISLKVIVRDLLRVEEDFRSALPGAPVRTDSGRRSRPRGSRSVSGIRVTPAAQANRAQDTILRALSDGPQSAAALARSTGMSFAGVLIELEALETAGVVARTARGVVQLHTPRPTPLPEAE